LTKTRFWRGAKVSWGRARIGEEPGEEESSISKGRSMQGEISWGKEKDYVNEKGRGG